jgi:hypothetical protein
MNSGSGIRSGPKPVPLVGDPRRPSVKLEGLRPHVEDAIVFERFERLRLCDIVPESFRHSVMPLMDGTSANSAGDRWPQPRSSLPD